jgi:hypothetical protein
MGRRHAFGLPKGRSAILLEAAECEWPSQESQSGELARKRHAYCFKAWREPRVREPARMGTNLGTKLRETVPNQCDVVQPTVHLDHAELDIWNYTDAGRPRLRSSQLSGRDQGRSQHRYVA